MTSPTDPSNPNSGWSGPNVESAASSPQAAAPTGHGWSAPQQGPGTASPSPGHAQPAQSNGWSPPSSAPAAGWSPPAAPHAAPAQGWTAPSNASQAPPGQGWSPPATPGSASQGWSPPQPAATAHAPPANAPAKWQRDQPVGETHTGFFFKAPESVEGPLRGVYLLLTLLSLPLLLPSFVYYLMVMLRFRRRGAAPALAVVSQLLASLLPFGLGLFVGNKLGVNEYVVGIPLVILFWLPLGARYALRLTTR